MFKSKRARVVALAGAGLVTAASVVAGVAIAAPGGGSSQAPYLQAGALVEADGTVVHSKGVASVTASGHVYCVEISDPDVDLSRAIVTATPRNTPGSTLRVIPGNCAGGKGITVGSYNPDGNGLANSFYVAVH
ncbi:hypothetical protein ACWDMR_31185 [Streptomyces althioticus]|uniref:hypothetical protein n=1 Tax=Streptomyces werraensis TaxID=68284 RepID=UPI003084B383|nr:hypothetical protein OHA60_00555 [Streptomyces cellulosae]WSB88600.1 hypothetical protein OHA60_34980 [Streptomyces cellulosae]WTC14490.1 hypothetical protein OH709_00555 [Streptomyces cellulosae]WUC46485.1 hypothetical protein OG692_33400 [Streptomyces cellulosae]